MFYYITDRGRDLLTAQYLFAGFYLLSLSFVLAIYSRLNKVSTAIGFILD